MDEQIPESDWARDKLIMRARSDPKTRTEANRRFYSDQKIEAIAKLIALIGFVIFCIAVFGF